MSWDILISYTFKAFLLPPGINLLLLIVGLAMLGFSRFRRSAIALISLGCISLVVLSTPTVSDSLIASLEVDEAIKMPQLKALQADQQTDRAIVVLSGGRLSRAPEYGEIDTVSAQTLLRIRYAGWLQKRLHLPVLLSGGSVFNEATSEAVLMNQVMVSSFNIAPKWIESQSKNTAENAVYSSQILKQNNINEILLITHAWHMPRAKKEFEKQGITVIPAPMSFSSNKKPGNFTDYLPNAKALHRSSSALHELLGNLWYDIRY
ncbi:YdcF family protein [Aliikangiella coralliicola]|uniref:YdcF family protein n=1 Tax=Aliikangiella coralliicola TaxID=2592383 RepID=A0A545UHM8_9GAMM|nr:YdcF family protein [Aliikangiella coralliicola]TQV88970.1 YdcF family protein [Aliikangiella coralliicola]